jgi:DNA-directed RNA polymerase specialized sigma24 family protein
MELRDNCEDTALNPDAGDLAYSALMALPWDMRRVLVLAAVYGCTALEISEREGIPLEIVKAQIRTSLSRVRTAIEPTRDPQCGLTPSPMRRRLPAD